MQARWSSAGGEGENRRRCVFEAFSKCVRDGSSRRASKIWTFGGPFALARICHAIGHYGEPVARCPLPVAH